MTSRNFFGILFWTLAGTLSVLSGLSQEASAPALDPQIAAVLHKVSADHIRATIEKLVSFGTRSTLSAQDPASIMAGHGIGAARDWIKSEFERYSRECGGCLEVKTDSFTEPPGERIPAPTQITNVYAVLKGSEAQNAGRIVLVTGHYDSRNSDPVNGSEAAPGANDDGSGTAVSLECARVLSQIRFPATIVFLAVAGEEERLNGSRHFAKMAKSEGWNVEAVLNNDIVGGDQSPQQDASVVRVFSEGVPAASTESELRLIRNLGGESDSRSRQLARYVEETSGLYAIPVKPMLIFRRDRYLRGGDQISFNEEGYAAVRFTEFRENFDHQHQNVRTEKGVELGDLPKFVNYDYVADVARLNAATLASLASAPAPPGNVRLSTKQLENDSTLTWEPARDDRTAGYEVLWRSTTSPYWEHSQLLGNVTRFTSHLAKDNVIFAVRSVDKSGHRSLPVVPSPDR